MRYCHKCGAATEDNIIRCPTPGCYGELYSSPKDGDRFTDQEIERVTKEVWKRIWKRHLLLIFGEFSLLMVLGLGAVYEAYRTGIKAVKQTLATNISNEFQTDRIRATVSDVASNQAKATIIAQINPEVVRFEKEVEGRLSQVSDLTTNAVSTVKHLEDQSKFLAVMTAAIAGSRSNYVHIVEWSRDMSFPFQPEASRAFESAVLLNSPNPLGGAEFTLDWNTDKFDPSKMTFAQALKEFNQMKSHHHPPMVNFVWSRTDFSKQERMGFLVNVIETDENLRAVLQACVIFSKEVGIENKVADFGFYSEWWKQNKDKIK